MLWSEICSIYPDQWLVVEALEAHTTPDHYRILDKLSVIEICSDGSSAIRSYRKLHKKHSNREFYFVHTSNNELRIQEREWVGIMHK